MTFGSLHSSKKSDYNNTVYVPGNDSIGWERPPQQQQQTKESDRIGDSGRRNSPSADPHLHSSSVSLGSASNDAWDMTNSATSIDGREERGECIKCGTKLFKTKKTGLFKTKEVKVPLSIPGQVERGQCLQCGTNSSNNSNSNNNPHSPSSSLSEYDVGVEGVPINGASVIQSSTSHQQNTKATYEGPFNVYGERDGKGTMTWENGDVYKGDFFNGNRHGSGTLSFADGSEYVGGWICNRQHGIGTRRWCNGDCYTGQYADGKRTGEGRFYFTNGDMYTGEWVAGVMQGSGRYYYASGQRFEGTFSHGKRKGKGKLQRTDGSLDIGVYVNDTRLGVGVRWSADRTQAWKMLDGIAKKKITIPEAVALDYDIESAAAAIDNDHERVV